MADRSMLDRMLNRNESQSVKAKLEPYQTRKQVEPRPKDPPKQERIYEEKQVSLTNGKPVQNTSQVLYPERNYICGEAVQIVEYAVMKKMDEGYQLINQHLDEHHKATATEFQKDLMPILEEMRDMSREISSATDVMRGTLSLTEIKNWIDLQANISEMFSLCHGTLAKREKSLENISAAKKKMQEVLGSRTDGTLGSMSEVEAYQKALIEAQADGIETVSRMNGNLLKVISFLMKSNDVDIVMLEKRCNTAKLKEMRKTLNVAEKYEKLENEAGKIFESDAIVASAADVANYKARESEKASKQSSKQQRQAEETAEEVEETDGTDETD
jgi:hypothetical protein